MTFPAPQFGPGTLKRFAEAVEEMRAPPPPVAPSPLMVQRERRRLARKLLAREYEGLRLYEPLPLAEQFHACNAVWRIIGESNRAGKTLVASVEDARVLTGTDPYNKYPKTNGMALFVGLERKHLALMYRTLFLPGAFKIIKDEHTGLYRSVRWDRNNPRQLQAYDEAYREKWRDAPPLIPERMVKRVGFDEPEVPRFVIMHNGWHSLWQSAAGNPDQGSHLNHVHFDEEMGSPEFYAEAHRGMTPLHETVAQRPKGIWSATSQVANVELAELREKAAADPNSDFVRRFEFLVIDNPYVGQRGYDHMMAGFNEEDQLTRVQGIPASQVRRIYPTYKPSGNSEDGTGHGCEPFEIDPLKFARYIIIDPSINHCATLFVAIDELGQYMTVYDGFEMAGKTTREWAKEVKRRQNGVKFEAPIMDEHRGKTRSEGRVITTVAYEFSKAMEEVGIQFRRRGPMEGFFPGCADVATRIRCLQTAMEIRGAGPFVGTSRLRVMRGIIPQLDKQLRRAQTDPKRPDKPLNNPKVPQDFRDDLEYAAAADLQYFPPEAEIPDDADKPTIYELFCRKRDRLRKKKRQQRYAYSTP